jgi:hypothetical protein
MSEPRPFLFQRQLGTTRRVISPATVLVMLLAVMSPSSTRTSSATTRHSSTGARQSRPADEYRAVTQPEGLELEEHLDQRKVELGGYAPEESQEVQSEYDASRHTVLV